MSEQRRTRVLVTGATGRLGRSLLPRLVSAGFLVRAGSRSTRPPSYGVEWVRMDLTSGDGLTSAVAEVDVIVHLAAAPYRGSYTRRVELDGIGRLAQAAGDAGHLLYLSIVGADEVPWGYFRTKVRTENLVMAGGLPWSIVRATQFHEFLDQILRKAARFPLLVLDPEILARPVDVRDVADRICTRIIAGPSEEIEEIGGPEVLDFDDAVRRWLAARGLRRPVLRVRLPGRLGTAFRAGRLVPNTEFSTRALSTGTLGWTDYLDQ